MIDLTEEQIKRYSRHILLQDVGLEGQEKLLNAKVLIIGAGGLGSPVALYLAAAGVGHIGIVDADVVDLSNLQRQVIHQTKDLNTPKVESAKEKMIAINDACVRLGKAFSHGGILRFQGQTFTHLPGTACYRCFFKEPPPAGTVPTSSQAGVLGAIAGMLGTIQAAEALKYFLGVGELLTDRLLTFDAKTMNFRTIKVKKRASCEICGDHPTIDHLIDYEQAACDLKHH